MNNLAEENQSIMKVCHTKQLLKMPTGVKPAITQFKHTPPQSINRSLYNNCNQESTYTLTSYTNVIPPVRGLLKNLS